MRGQTLRVLETRRVLLLFKLNLEIHPSERDVEVNRLEMHNLIRGVKHFDGPLVLAFTREPRHVDAFGIDQEVFLKRT